MKVDQLLDIRLQSFIDFVLGELGLELDYDLFDDRLGLLLTADRVFEHVNELGLEQVRVLVPDFLDLLLHLLKDLFVAELAA